MREHLALNPNDNHIRIWLSQLLNNKVVIAFILVIALFVAGYALVPGFGRFNHTMAVLQASFFLGLVALGQTIVIMSGKEGLDLSVGAMVTLGVVLGATLVDGQDARLPLALLVTLGSGFLLGTVNGLGIVLLNIAPLIMTLAWGIVIEGLILFAIQGHMFGTGSRILELLGSGSLRFGTLQIPYVVFIWMIIMSIVWLLMTRTKVGYVLYAVGENDRAATLMGIRVNYIRIMIYGISGALSCLTGLLLLGYVGSAHLNLGARYILPSVVAVIIGGIRFGGGAGSYLGVVAGAIFLTTLQSILTTFDLSEGGKQVVTGGVLLVLLLVYATKKNQ